MAVISTMGEPQVRSRAACSSLRAVVAPDFLCMKMWSLLMPAAAKLPTIIPKTPEQVGWEPLFHHGDRRLNRDLRGENDRRKWARSA
ncbi:hypothetical protein ACSBOX_17830 [Arthrobacter sp. KN11-1C]|uniref:hypothetical protein n=1 Tax=Arthrobacter sp. KN11-1C TaxID=3445774 RepID=UPI003F9F844C